MEQATTTATLVTLAAAEMDTPVPFHAVVRGDQGAQAAADLKADLEAEALRHHLRQGGEDRARHQEAIHCCRSIQWHLEASVRGIPTWSRGLVDLANV